MIDPTALRWLAVVGGFILIGLTFAERWMDRSIDQRPRAYTGPVKPDADDWFEPVADYFQRRWESQVRTRAAVNHVCGIELSTPQTNRSRAADTAGPMTKGDTSNGITEH
jgi:hypothetical protein